MSENPYPDEWRRMLRLARHNQKMKGTWPGRHRNHERRDRARQTKVLRDFGLALQFTKHVEADNEAQRMSVIREWLASCFCRRSGPHPHGAGCPARRSS